MGSGNFEFALPNKRMQRTDKPLRALSVADFEAAKEYVDVIEEIEKTKDLQRLQALEEKRVELHWNFIEVLKEQGITHKDREHATRIALRIAKEEL